LSTTLREFALTEIRSIIPQRAGAFTPDETIARVLGSLKEADAYEAAVISGNAHGIITMRDLLDVDQPARTKIDGVWRATGSVSPEDPVLTLCESLVKNNIRALPVVENGVVGLATQMDVVSAMAEVSELSEHPAKELTRSPVWSLDIDEGVANARRTMLERGISHIPVVENGRLVGVVTAKDIVQTFIAPASKTTAGERVGRRISRFSGQVGGIMDTRPCTVSTDASVLDVVTLLRDQGKSACFMTDPGHRVLGIITPRDTMGPILRLRIPEELPVYIMGIEEEDFGSQGRGPDTSSPGGRWFRGGRSTPRPGPGTSSRPSTPSPAASGRPSAGASPGPKGSPGGEGRGARVTITLLPSRGRSKEETPWQRTRS